MMGLSASKIEKQISEVEIQESSVPSTPILTPRTRRIGVLDPRSPSSHISRTPLEVLSAVAEKLETLKENEPETLNNETPIKNKRLIIGIDPRSPTTEFKRTPIVLNTSESELPKSIRNKNLEKVLRTEIQSSPTSINDKAIFSEKSSNIVPPKLLESSPIKPRSETYKRKSFVGLLETNIDFTETDLDVVLREKCRIKEESEISTVSNENVEKIDLCPCNTELLQDSEESLIVTMTDANTTKKLSSKVIEELQEPCEDEQNNSDTSQHEIEIATKHITSLDDVEDISSSPLHIKSAPVTPPDVNITVTPPLPATLHESKSVPITPTLVNITADVKELDKKLTNLIYEDTDIVVCPRIVKLKDPSERSPLRNRNGSNSENKKSAQKLKVSDKPRRTDFAVSKIPVFKEKARRGHVQCENTPPTNIEKRKMKARKSNWDSGDATLYI